MKRIGDTVYDVHIRTPEQVKAELCAAYDDFLEGIRCAWRGCAGNADLHEYDRLYTLERRIFEGRVARAIESVS